MTYEDVRWCTEFLLQNVHTKRVREIKVFGMKDGFVVNDVLIAAAKPPLFCLHLGPSEAHPVTINLSTSQHAVRSSLHCHNNCLCPVRDKGLDAQRTIGGRVVFTSD